jgi:hypothetical protein
MSGIFYDPKEHRLRAVRGTPQPDWAFVTHNLHAGTHQVRRILREWLPSEELAAIDWSVEEYRQSA